MQRPKLWKIRENKVLATLISFKKKKQKIESDVEMSEYLRVFMNTVTSSYRIAELIHSGKFAMVDDRVVVKTAKRLLCLVPIIGKVHQIIH